MDNDIIQKSKRTANKVMEELTTLLMLTTHLANTPTNSANIPEELISFIEVNKKKLLQHKNTTLFSKLDNATKSFIIALRHNSFQGIVDVLNALEIEPYRLFEKAYGEKKALIKLIQNLSTQDIENITSSAQKSLINTDEYNNFWASALIPRLIVINGYTQEEKDKEKNSVLFTLSKVFIGGLPIDKSTTDTNEWLKKTDILLNKIYSISDKYDINSFNDILTYTKKRGLFHQQSSFYEQMQLNKKISTTHKISRNNKI